jgi:WD40 repeat protein/Tfp pilus assembly protein PilF
MTDLYADPAQTWDGWPAGIVSVDFDDNLEVYARADRQGNVSVRRVAGDVELYRIPGRGKPTEVVLSRDARHVAVWEGHGPLRVWRLDGPKPALLLFTDSARHLDYRADSRQMAVATVDGVIRLFDLATGKLLHRLEPDIIKREIFVALHPREPLVAFTSYFSPGRYVQVRDLRTGVVVWSQRRPKGSCGLAWSPEGRLLAVGGGDDPSISLLDGTNGKPVRTLATKSTGMTITFNHAGDRLAGVGWSSTAQLFDVATGQLLFQSAPTAPTAALPRFARDDRRLAGRVTGNGARIWQVGDGREYRTLVNTRAEAVNYFSGAVGAGGRLLAVGLEDGVGLWDLDTGAELGFLPTGERVTEVLFEPSGALRTNGLAGLLRWPIQKDVAAPGTLLIGPPQRLPLGPGASGISQSGDGRVLAQAQRAVGREERYAGGWILHVDRSDPPIRIDAGNDIQNISVSPDGRWVATDKFCTPVVKVWEARTGKFVRQLLPAEGAGGCRFSPDGRWLATCLDGNRLFAVGSWEPGPRLGEGGLPSFAPDGKLAALESGHGVVRLVVPDTGREVARLEDPNLDPARLFFSPDGTRLITVTNGNVKGIHVWDLRALRRRLERLGLDCAALPGPGAQGPAGPLPPLRVQLVLGDPHKLVGRPGQVSAQSVVMLCTGVLQANPNDVEAYHARAHAYAQLGRRADAIADYTEALKRQPTNCHFLEYRAVNHLFLRQYEQALADLEKALAIQPEQPRVCNKLAWAYVSGPEKLRDPAKALPLAERAVRLAPNQASYLNTLGVAQYRAGKYADARATLEKSLRAGAGRSDAFDLYFLALCHHRLGDAVKARECYERAVKWQHSAKLSPGWVQELNALRAEAAKELGLPAPPAP